MKYPLLTVPALLAALLSPAGLPAAGQDPRLRSYYCDEVKKPFFSGPADGKGLYTARRTAAMPESFLMPKPAGARRVFVIGESVAALLGPGKDAAYTGGVEIINCGMGGYESSRIYGVLREILAYSPDLVVVLSGNNDTNEESCPGLACELRRRKARLFAGFYSLNNSPREARKRALLKLHEDNLLKMAGAARKAGVPIVFCTLPATLKDLPPSSPAPFENREFTLGYRLFYSGKYKEALAAFNRGLEADRREPYLNFYAAKALGRLGREKDAAAHYSNALNFDTIMSRAGRERNDAIRRAASEEGACAADLEKLFLDLSSGLPGFDLFTDGMHWNVAHNGAVWEEIFRAAGLCGIEGFGGFSAGPAARWAEPPEATARKRLAYAFSWIEEKELNEGSLAELSRIREERPALLKEAAASAERLGKLLPDNFWSNEKLSRLKDLYPFFLAHLAETERRARNYAGALALCGKALSLKPGHPVLKLERAQVLADTGAKPENEFASLAAEPMLGGKAAAFAAAYGFRLPEKTESPAAGPASRKNAAASKKLSDQAVKKIFAGDFKAAEALLLKAVEKNRFNPEALMNLCALRQKDGRTVQALEACRGASASVRQDPANNLPSLELLSCDAALESHKLLVALRRGAEAAAVLAPCVKQPPPSWPGLDAAKAALKKR
ncbi:MAG: hypothetical protein HY550_12300 [Elusimicrobia bacterium]|nr:hypothetical protein [Elusimicrobiota bacterium]